MKSSDTIDFAALIERVARRLLGEPNKPLSSSQQLRFGKQGSISVELDGSGRWYKHEPPTQGGGTLDLVIYKTDCRTRAEAAEWVKREILRMNDAQPKHYQTADTKTELVAEYQYYDDRNNLRYRVCRMSNKSFPQSRWDKATQKWVNTKDCMENVIPLPYLLPQVLVYLDEHPGYPIFICEGEKDALNLATRLQVAATCNSGGAGNWPEEISRWFKDEYVVLLPDNDDAGRDHAQDVARKLYAVGAKVIIVYLPNLPEKGDVTDWLDAGGTIEELCRLAGEAPEWKPDDDAETKQQKKPGLITVLASQVLMRPVFWLWHLYIPLGKFSITAGMPKHGKSAVCLSFAAMVSKGGVWPDGEKTSHEPADVLIFSSEDDPEDTIVPRLVAMGADLTRIEIVKGVFTKDGDTVMFSITENLEAMKEHLRRRPNTKFVVIDPVAAFLGDTDGWVETSVRRGLSPLREVAAEFNIAIMGIMHFKKAVEPTAMYQIGGSVGFVAQARAIFTTIREKNSDRFLFLPAGANLSKADHGFAYRIEKTVVHNDKNEPITTIRIEWDGQVDGTADQIMQQQRESKSESAKKWLTERLAGGAVEVKTLKLEAGALSDVFSWSAVERAAEEIATKNRKGFASGSTWELK